MSFDEMEMKKILPVGIVMGIGIVCLIGSIAVVSTRNTGVVKTFSKATGNTMSEGLHFKAPFVTTVKSMCRYPY